MNGRGFFKLARDAQGRAVLMVVVGDEVLELLPDIPGTFKMHEHIACTATLSAWQPGAGPSPGSDPDAIAQRVADVRMGMALAMGACISEVVRATDAEIDRVVGRAMDDFVQSAPAHMSGREASFLAAAKRAFDKLEEPSELGAALADAEANAPGGSA